MQQSYGAKVARTARVLEKIAEMLAAVQGKFHCWLKHGAVGPARDTHFGHLEIFCPICGRVFWHDQANA
jgi:hypothetical protein